MLFDMGGIFIEAYEKFAHVYDDYIDIDYNDWILYIHEIWKKEGLNPEIILDLGCGTGNITNILAKEGYDMIGIDNSEEMLSIAIQKSKQENLDVLYILQDMREFELYGTVNCILSLCDSLNYITSENELLTVFKLVNNYLHPSGLFIFDMNTEYKFKYILGDNTFAEANDNSAYIWENFYDEKEKINEYYMNFFIKNENGLYERSQEEHYQKAYDIETVKRLIEKSGMKFVNVYDAYTFNKPNFESERLYFVAREVLKTKNK